MTTDMVHIVAEALWKSDHPHTQILWAGEGTTSHNAYVRRARAAISALMEPTEEMLSRGSSGSSQYAADLARHTWQAMITAALGEDQN